MKKNKNRVVIDGVTSVVEDNSGSVVTGSTGVRINQRASGSSLNVSSAAGSIVIGDNMTSTVINNGEAWINGERCYPKSLIEELDAAYRDLVAVAYTLEHVDASEAQDKLIRKARVRVDAAREALDLR